MRKEQINDYCQAEFENIEEVINEIFKLTGSKKNKFNIVELAALGTFLHNFYNGVENILKRILDLKDIRIADTSTWHKDLLQMVKGERIISNGLYKGLLPYLTFRHFFIHSYSPHLVWKEMKALVDNLEDTYKDFKDTVKKYLKNIGD